MPPISTKDLNLYENTEKSELLEEEKLPLSLHLEELRKRILISFFTFSLTCLIGFILSKDTINLLVQTAPKETFFFQIKPGEFFFTSIKVSLYIATVFSSPVILWQIFNFILPGLKNNEKKIISPIVIGAPLFFLFGVVFSYHFILPSMLNFLFNFGKEVISTSISIENFISFSLMILAISGLAFTLPIAIYTLACARIINAKTLINNWKYAIFLSVLLGAILTPTPDPFNMSIIAGILIALYFFSYGILKIFFISQQ